MGYGVPNKHKNRKKNLIDNARRFRKEGWERPAESEDQDETEVQQRKSIEWTT